MADSTQSTGGGNRVFLIIAALIIVAGLGWLFMARGGGIGSTAALPTPAEFQGLTATIEPDASVGVMLGSEDRPVEVLEFIDYSCPACAQFAGFAGRLLRQNYVEGSDAPVRWVTYDFVLGGFPHSLPAAMAARCAGEQGAYWPVHDLLFSRQARWARGANPDGELRDIIDQVGIDAGAWGECVSESRYIEEIAASRKYGEQMGVGSTPTIFVNGQRVDLSGVDPYTYIEGLIRAELASEGQEAAGTAGSADGGG